jgi:hypothetical protein
VRYVAGLVLFLGWQGVAVAVTPPLDNTPGFFSGEWAGSGESGSYCYMSLEADGSGLVLIDGGAGDWLGARLKWRNRQQTLQVESIIPLSVSPQRRIMPLETFALRSGFNQSLSLSWSRGVAGCQLQKVEATARHLERAREAVKAVRQGGGK